MVKTNSGIYKITNFKNGKVYIGSSTDVDTRKEAHLRCLCNGRSNPLFQRDFIDYGIDVFTFEVLENCEPDNLAERETYYIEKYNSSNSDYGYNLQKTSRRKPIKYADGKKLDRTKQRNFDFGKYPKSIEILDNMPHYNRVAWLAEAIEEKHNKESNLFTEAQEQRIIEIIREMMKNG